MLEDDWPDCDFCGDTKVLPILMVSNQGIGNNAGGFRKGGEAPCPMCTEEEEHEEETKAHS